jgi:hypothetical protein
MYGLELVGFPTPGFVFVRGELYAATPHRRASLGYVCTGK